LGDNAITSPIPSAGETLGIFFIDTMAPVSYKLESYDGRVKFSNRRAL
jgi:hypothetical protein